MNINDALNLLNLSDSATQKEIKKAFKVQSLKYHPDRNPAGSQMMIAINAAYEFLKSLSDPVVASNGFNQNDYSEELSRVLNELLDLEGLILEICGNWIWITGDTKPHAKRLGRKEGGIGCFYASKKRSWYYRPAEYKSSNRKGVDMDSIRATYGSTTPLKTKSKAIAA